MTSYRTIAIYARVSTEEQAEEGFSIAAQLETLKQYAKQEKCFIHDHYVDEGISGKTITNRPALQRLLSDAKKNLFEEVVVWKINRISRNQLDLLQIVDELQRHNVSFRSYSENFETQTPMGRFALQMMGSVAELERNTIVENVKLGMKQRAKQGKWNGGAVLGYKTVELNTEKSRRKKETRLEIVDSEAQIVQLIFNRYASGKGFKAIANELNHLGYKTKRNKPFSIFSIKCIITNPVYIGMIRFNKQEDWSNKRRKGTNPNPILVEGEHEPIISKDLWEKVQHMYDNKCKKPTRVYYGSFPFTGVMRCPVCGHGMVAQRASRKNKDGQIKYTPYYQCGQFANKGSSVCRANSVRADYAEKEILSRIDHLWRNPQLIRDLTNKMNNKRIDQMEPLKRELEQLKAELKRLNRKKEKLFDLYDEDVLDIAGFKQRNEELSEKENVINEQIYTIKNQLNEDHIETISAETVQNLLHSFSTLFGNTDNQNRKMLVHSLIQKITINENRQINTIEFQFNYIDIDKASFHKQGVMINIRAR